MSQDDAEDGDGERGGGDKERGKIRQQTEGKRYKRGRHAEN